MSDQSPNAGVALSGIAPVDDLLDGRIAQLRQTIGRGTFDDLVGGDDIERNRAIFEQVRLPRISVPAAPPTAAFLNGQIPAEILDGLDTTARDQVARMPHAGVVWQFRVTGPPDLVDAAVASVEASPPASRPWSVRGTQSVSEIAFLVVHDPRTLSERAADDVRTAAFGQVDRILTALTATRAAIERVNDRLPTLIMECLRQRDTQVSNETAFIARLNAPR